MRTRYDLPLRSAFFTGLVLLLTASFAPADVPAPLGRNLSERVARMAPGETAVVILYLKDKGPDGLAAPSSAEGLVSARSLERRAKVMQGRDLVTTQDLPVKRSYIDEISTIATRTRHALKWFNAVSAEATLDQIEALRRLPFVREIELVGRWKGTPEPEGADLKSLPDAPASTQLFTLDYGASITQNAQIGTPNVHNLGIYGEGVMVGVFDNGFRLLTHESFSSMTIVAQYDFVDKKVSVIPNNPSVGFGSHGVNTLSTVGGYMPGQLIGPAFRSTYVLARTENDSSETALEEDNWAAAIEWADSIGIDVASTSLGYLDYDGGGGWTWVNMDGNTTLITQAADHAVALGIVVVNSAGNGGAGNGTDNTLGAPADGDSVIAAGAVTSSGVRSSFSSVGPTTDVPARIKPDVMAMGTGVRVASSTNTTQYTSLNGTSFSCPLTAGVAALILSANPNLTPMQVRDAMRNTASNAASPDNLYGWGLLDADSAIGSVGIVPMAKLTGTLFHDINGNGALDDGEPSMPDSGVVLSGTSTDTVPANGVGAFLFDSVAPGPHTISAALSPGWVVTSDSPDTAPWVLHRDSLGGFAIGIFKTGSASGVLYADSNRNGVRDLNEPGLESRTVVLAGPVNDTILTAPDGSYAFDGLGPGFYTVAQLLIDEWLQSTPPSYGPHEFTVMSGFDSTTLDFGSYHEGVNVYAVASGWNLLSLPVDAVEPLVDSIYPNASTQVSIYNGAYQNVDTLTNGLGYWVKFPATQNIQITGTDRPADTVVVAQGWNLIGSISVPLMVSTIVSEPSGIIVSKFFGYQDRAYVGLDVTDVLQPHAGYWVKCSAAGTIILDSGPPAR